MDDQEVMICHKVINISGNSNEIAKPRHKVLCLKNTSEEPGWISE